MLSKEVLTFENFLFDFFLLLEIDVIIFRVV